MFLEKYRFNISFNVLAMFGLFSFICFCTPESEELRGLYDGFVLKQEYGITALASILTICVRTVILTIVFFFIMILEKIFHWKTIQKNFINTKFFFTLQIFGCLCIIIPNIYIFLFLFSFFLISIH